MMSSCRPEFDLKARFLSVPATTTTLKMEIISNSLCLQPHLFEGDSPTKVNKPRLAIVRSNTFQGSRGSPMSQEEIVKLFGTPVKIRKLKHIPAEATIQAKHPKPEAEPVKICNKDPPKIVLPTSPPLVRRECATMETVKIFGHKGPPKSVPPTTTTLVRRGRANKYPSNLIQSTTTMLVRQRAAMQTTSNSPIKEPSGIFKRIEKDGDTYLARLKDQATATITENHDTEPEPHQSSNINHHQISSSFTPSSEISVKDNPKPRERSGSLVSKLCMFF